jgi:hypothetical protein
MILTWDILLRKGQQNKYYHFNINMILTCKVDNRHSVMTTNRALPTSEYVIQNGY